MEEKIYKTDKIIIYWKPNLCKHAAKCVHGVPSVFEVGRRPWIKPENSSAEKIASVINQCPSGALTYKMRSVE